MPPQWLRGSAAFPYDAHALNVDRAVAPFLNTSRPHPPESIPMHTKIILVALFLAFSPAQAIEQWVYVARNLQVDRSADDLIALMERAAAAGYTHVLLADSKLARLGTLGDAMPRYTRNTGRVKSAAARLHIEVVPALFNIGYSNAMLFHDPNLVEALPVRNVPLVVEGGIARVAEQTVSLPGGDFSDLKKWSWKDDNVVAEDGAARANANGGNARIVQRLKVQRWRQYHVSVRVKTRDIIGEPPGVKAIAATGGRVLNFDSLGTKPTQDWTSHHAIFNSQEFTDVNLFLGMWGTKSGTLWWDDARIEEVAFVNLARRDGCPLTITTANGQPLAEERDFFRLRDPLLGAKPWPGEFDVFHDPPQLRTKLPDGTRLLASYYHAATVNEGQATICLSEPRVLDLLRDEAARVHALWGAKGYMMSHDECRVMNWCAACERRGLTPGAMLAENVRECAKLLREVNPGGRIHVWSDMFDPNHNAVRGPYYLVNGSLLDSWDGLDRDVIVLPWHFGKRTESLRFFAGRGNRQVIAAYYDSRPAQVQDWLAAARGVEGVLGVMFTTWRRNYRDLEAFAKAVSETR